VDSLVKQGVDGIVISEPIDEGTDPIQVGVPVLILGAPPAFAAPRVISVGVDSTLLARVATEHLLDLGHRTVHHLAGPGGGSPPGTARPAGGPRWRRAAFRRRRPSKATGRPRPATGRATCSPPTRPSRPCSARTTTWPSGWPDEDLPLAAEQPVNHVVRASTAPPSANPNRGARARH
jgi:hypothetical protein